MVKYADSPTAQVEVSIDAPPAAVWPLVSDISLPARFSEEFQGAEWIDDGPALDATFRGHNRHPFVGEWSVLCTVTDYEPGQIFEWTVGDLEDRVARWRFEIEEEGSGCLLRFRAVMGPGPSGLTPAIQQMPEREEEIVAQRLEEWSANMQRTVEGIAALAEDAASTGGR